MKDFISKVTGNKKEWRAMKARIKALPHDYQVVYDEIMHYIWKSSAFSSMDVFNDLLDLFEEGVANGRSVLEITGDDVAVFCDGLIQSKKTYVDNWREKMNHDIAKKLGK
jgi:DNA-binding ferritin-like protein (Dps family)